jgi:NADH:ubiquinone oxidoreductase subunit 2 (subunit N)
MTLAHQETIGMGVVTAFFAVVLLLAIAYKRRTGERHPWFYPSAALVVLGLVLMAITWSGTVLAGW